MFKIKNNIIYFLKTLILIRLFDIVCRKTGSDRHGYKILFMSGTTLENRLEEMLQLISVLQPNISEQLSQELHLLQPNEFKQIVTPVYLRRNRKVVLAGFPELEIIPQWIDFGKEERRIYSQAVKDEKLMLMMEIEKERLV